ncbi:MAG: SDR family oxidoreductase [Deltaproteobacteria bacterium]|nr:SDR family oxidoreductase [Deltaproteobacteria bacterium]MCL4873362.1 SDR family oxidoreductase [bacterium]
MRTEKGIFSCEGKAALVTGGCGLVGKAAAAALVKAGAYVVAADIDRRAGKALSKSLGCGFVRLDIGSETSIRAGLREAVRKTGRIDILVNSAYPRTKDWGRESEKAAFSSWKRNVNSHLGGYFLLSRLACEEMKASGGGSVISMASVYGVVGPDFSLYSGTDMTTPAAYPAIKAGILGYTRYLAARYGGHNIRVNAVSPGGVHNGQQASFVRRYSAKVPLGRMAAPEDISGAVVFLASDAAGYITGQNIIVDGGFTAV